MRWLSLLLVVGCADPAITAGVDAFESGDVPGAVAAWSDVEGDPSWRIRYDLGLAAWEQGDVPRAVGLFRGAAQDRPRNPHVSHNLALARGHLSGVPEPAPEALAWLGVVTASEVGWLGALLLSVFSVGAFRRRERLGGYGVAAVGGLLCVGLSLYGDRAQRAAPVGVALADAVVRDAPVVQGLELGRLTAGTEAIVEGVCNGFARVRTTRPIHGWVPVQSVLIVTPGFGDGTPEVKTSLEVPCGLGEQPSL